MYFPPTEILKIAYFLQPWARRAHRNPQNVCRRPSSTLSLSQWPELVFKHNNLSPKSWWGLPFSSKRMNVTRAKNMLQCLHTFTFTMTGNCLQREVACPLCEFETDILIRWSMCEGLKSNPSHINQRMRMSVSFGQRAAKITLWASTCWPSSQARVTSAKLLSSFKFPKAQLCHSYWPTTSIWKIWEAPPQHNLSQGRSWKN